MELKKYGVILHRLTIEKIELVRNWRNDTKISKYMFFRDYISEDMQLKWFNNINNEFNFYFIIEYEKKEIGLVNMKDVDYVKKCAEGGLFIYNDEYLNSDVSFRAYFCILDFVFEELNLGYIYGKIIKGNKNAIHFNKMSGADISDSEESIFLKIEKDNYIKQRNKYIRFFT